MTFSTVFMSIPNFSSTIPHGTLTALCRVLFLGPDHSLTCALQLQTSDHEGAVVDLRLLPGTMNGHVEVKFLERPMIRLSDVLTRSSDVRLGNEQVSEGNLLKRVKEGELIVVVICMARIDNLLRSCLFSYEFSHSIQRSISHFLIHSFSSRHSLSFNF